MGMGGIGRRVWKEKKKLTGYVEGRNEEVKEGMTRQKGKCMGRGKESERRGTRLEEMTGGLGLEEGSGKGGDGKRK